jgi:DNA polymerase III subunit epsilon
MFVWNQDSTKNLNFVAIDFETADRRPDSACAIGMVRVQESKVVERRHFLIRPPRSFFEFTWVHGITWSDVKDQPTFLELWPHCESIFKGSEFFVAHNASFDRGVLRACCGAAEIEYPSLEFVCTMRLARKQWGVRPTRLPNVCDFLGLSLNHHNALSDAEACAQIMLALAEPKRP